MSITSDFLFICSQFTNESKFSIIFFVVSNEPFIEQFLYEIDRSIETGNGRIIEIAVKNYINKIPFSYINWANNILNQLIIEKIEDLNLS